MSQAILVAIYICWTECDLLHSLCTQHRPNMITAVLILAVVASAQASNLQPLGQPEETLYHSDDRDNMKVQLHASFSDGIRGNAFPTSTPPLGKPLPESLLEELF